MITTEAKPMFKLGALLALLVTLAACGGVDSALPERDVSKQALRASDVQTLSDDEDEDEDEDENEDEDESEDEDDVEAIKDGGFEAGTMNPFWTTSPGTLCTVSVCGDGAGTAGPEDGNVWAWFGGTPNATVESVEQTIMLPRGDAELEFELWVGATSASVFSFTVSLDNTVVYTLDEDDYDGDADDGYEDIELDLSDFTDDKAHVLSFDFSKDAQGDLNVSLDEVSLEVEALEDAVGDISDDVVALPLKPNVEKPLLSKLNAATKAFARNQDRAGAGQLKAFSQQVKAQRGKKIPTAAATSLITQAQALIKIAK